MSYLVLLNALSSVPSAPRFSSARSRCLRPPHCTTCLAAPAASLCSYYGLENSFCGYSYSYNPACPLRVRQNISKTLRHFNLHCRGWESETATPSLERRLVIF